MFTVDDLLKTKHYLANESGKIAAIDLSFQIPHHVYANSQRSRGGP